MRPPRIPAFIASAALLLLPAWSIARAQDPASPTNTEELKSLEDPTIIVRRMSLDWEADRFKDNSSYDKLTLSTVWAWRVSDNQEFGLRLNVPLAWHGAGDVEGDHNTSGLSDIEFAGATAWRLSDTLRVGGGLEVRANTATDDTLGDNVWRLKPFASVGWDATKFLTLGFTAEYNQSIYEESEVAKQRYLEMYFPATWILPNDWAVTTQYKGKVDFEDNGHWTDWLKLAISKRLPNMPLSISASIEKDIDGANKRFESHIVFTYFFQ